MKTRLLIAAGAAALLLSTASAPAATPVLPSAGAGGFLVAFCPDGSEWLAALPAPDLMDEAFPGSVAILDAALSVLPEGCDALVLAPSPGGVPESDPGKITAQDAAVWSRGTPPVVRASDTP
jgi:hypothetical protein